MWLLCWASDYTLLYCYHEDYQARVTLNYLMNPLMKIWYRKESDLLLTCFNHISMFLFQDVDYQTQTRPSSAIHIRLSKLSPSPSPLPTPSHSTLSTPSHPSLPGQQADIGTATDKNNKTSNEQETFVSQRTKYKGSSASKTLWVYYIIIEVVLTAWCFVEQ